MSDKLKRSWQGRVVNTKLLLDKESAFRQSLIAYNDKQVILTLEVKRKRRSDQQNRYYWGVIIKILSTFFGYEEEEMHEALKMKFLLVHGGDGKPDTIRSTRKLTTVEFNDYIDKVIRWAAKEFNVVLPDPNQWQDAGYYE
ncbi:MAG: hypothetical protein EPO24_09310 [Bacteroidetes bacterium]|nr:MAG: hypothetical protein EPO24_09310 [Bacteroidota bacterium]